MNEHEATEATSTPQLTSEQRRIVGVLVEKAKTTPENYPLSLNALTNGCNQKSNRSPQMNLAADDVEVEMDRLREMGAVVEVVSSGRVPKYKHRMYDWLKVDKVEAAVMAELLLRGEQTIGELRGRAARMEPIPDLGALKPILAALSERGLVISLTPEGRGQLVTHSIYSAEELARLQKRVESGQLQAAARPSNSSAPAPIPPSADLSELKEEVARLREIVEQLSARLERLET